MIGAARHSETLEPLVVYRPLYGDSGWWVRPHAMFFGQVETGGRLVARFARIDHAARQIAGAAPYHVRILGRHDVAALRAAQLGDPDALAPRPVRISITCS